MPMNPEEQHVYDGLLAVVREEMQVLNGTDHWGLTEAQLDNAARYIASEIDFGFSYQWRSNRGPNYKPHS
jgi:hypothetical protein